MQGSWGLNQGHAPLATASTCLCSPCPILSILESLLITAAVVTAVLV
jgi:hypothetical protein